MVNGEAVRCGASAPLRVKRVVAPGVGLSAL
jgi:hypothetical protein